MEHIQLNVGAALSALRREVRTRVEGDYGVNGTLRDGPRVFAGLYSDHFV
jgi:hypothetical protein